MVENSSQEQGVAIKGVRYGILITLGEEKPFSEIIQKLNDKLSDANRFFTGAQVVIDLGGRDLHWGHHRSLMKLIEDYQLELLRIISRSESTRRFLEKKGQGVVSSIKELAKLEEFVRFKEPVTKNGLESGVNTILIQKTLRSGQVLSYDENVVIVGDVNPGAQVVSAGNIIVAGRMRGIAHAGSGGDENSMVVAFRLEPVQLRIASYINRSPDGATEPTRPEKAYIRDGRIVVKSIGR